MYFLFVVILCAVSLAASVAVKYIYERSAGSDATLPMPKWVSRPIFVALNLTIQALCCLIYR